MPKIYHGRGKDYHGDYRLYLCQLQNAIIATKALLNSQNTDAVDWSEQEAMPALRDVILPALEGAENIAHETK